MIEIKLKDGRKVKIEPLTPKKAFRLRDKIGVNVFTKPIFDWKLEEIKTLLKTCIVNENADEIIDYLLEDETWNDFLKVLEKVFPQIPSFRHTRRRGT